MVSWATQRNRGASATVRSPTPTGFGCGARFAPPVRVAAHASDNSTAPRRQKPAAGTRAFGQRHVCFGRALRSKVVYFWSQNCPHTICAFTSTGAHSATASMFAPGLQAPLQHAKSGRRADARTDVKRLSHKLC